MKGRETLDHKGNHRSKYSRPLPCQLPELLRPFFSLFGFARIHSNFRSDHAGFVTFTYLISTKSLRQFYANFIFILFFYLLILGDDFSCMSPRIEQFILCFFMFCTDVNDFSQFEQLNGLSPV